MKFYGSYINRIQENNQFCEEIKVGTGMTEYSYSDREAYEVIAVKDQKHVTVRKYDHIAIGEPMSNNWKLVSNENNSIMNLVKRGNYWYSEIIVTAEQLEKEMVNGKLPFEKAVYLAVNGFDIEYIKTKGFQKKYHKVNVSFGIADYHYDYEF